MIIAESCVYIILFFYENKLVSALFFHNNYTCFNTVHDFSSTGEQKKEW